MRSAMIRHAAFGLVASWLLVACQDEVPAETTDDAERTAAGEVLGGTISDDMLPLDRLRSRSPAMRESDDTDGSGSAPAATASGAADNSPAEAEEAPAAPAADDAE